MGLRQQVDPKLGCSLAEFLARFCLLKHSILLSTGEWAAAAALTRRLICWHQTDLQKKEPWSWEGDRGSRVPDLASACHSGLKVRNGLGRCIVRPHGPLISALRRPAAFPSTSEFFAMKPTNHSNLHFSSQPRIVHWPVARYSLICP